MKLRLQDLELKISRNKLNRFWHPIGYFRNISKIKIENRWYDCDLNFAKKSGKYYVQIHNPKIVEKKTYLVKEILVNGIYKELETSKLKFNFIQYLMNVHPINSRSYNIRKFYYQRERTILIFVIAIIASINFYIINIYFGNVLINLIAENTLVQTIFFFLTISGFISIFHPFSIRKEIEKVDIQDIIKETLEKQRNIKETEDRATF